MTLKKHHINNISVAQIFIVSVHKSNHTPSHRVKIGPDIVERGKAGLGGKVKNYSTAGERGLSQTVHGCFISDPGFLQHPCSIL